MSLAGYNEATYYSALTAVADNEDCSSTRDSSNMARTDSGLPEDATSPWAVWRTWAADTVSEGGLSEGSGGSSWASDCEPGLSRRQSARASLGGYNCTGARAIDATEGGVADGVGNSTAETKTHLSTIGEVLEMGMDWFGDTSERQTESEEQEAAQVFRLNGDEHAAEARQADDTSIFGHYDALDDAAQNSGGWEASMPWAEDLDDDSLDMGLQDDPIAEAGFIFAVEYGQACVSGMDFSRSSRANRVAAAG